MSCKLDFDQKEKILHVTASGTRSLPTILAFSTNVMQACRDWMLDKVLIDIRLLEGHLSTSSLFTLPTQHFPKIREQSVLSPLAIIDLANLKLSNRFFENLAVRRGLNVRFFLLPQQLLPGFLVDLTRFVNINRTNFRLTHLQV